MGADIKAREANEAAAAGSYGYTGGVYGSKVVNIIIVILKAEISPLIFSNQVTRKEGCIGKNAVHHQQSRINIIRSGLYVQGAKTVDYDLLNCNVGHTHEKISFPCDLLRIPMRSVTIRCSRHCHSQQLQAY